MIDCRDFDKTLRAPGFSGPTDEMRAHAATCRACDAALRGAMLLRLGSERPGDAVTAPGFEARLRARLAGAGAVATGAAAEPDWSAAIGALLRPALGIAAALALVTAGLYYRAVSTTAAGGADLASLLESDPAVSAALSARADALLSGGAVNGASAEATR